MGENLKEYPFRFRLSLKPLIDYLNKIASASDGAPCQIEGRGDASSHRFPSLRKIPDGRSGVPGT